MTSSLGSLSLTNYMYSSGQKTEEKSIAEKSLVPKVAEAPIVTGVAGAYNLDLSTEAQAYLKSLENKPQAAESTEKDYGFKLTVSEQKQLDKIVTTYTDKPYTQENFDKLQAELKYARLDNLNLAAKDMLRSFNSTATLMSALSGDTTMLNANERMKGQHVKSETYTDQIAKDWYNQIAIEADQI